MMNKISIIIPFYNTKIEYVKQCLDSVKIQTYQNYECIIVNDCSNEQSSINFINEYVSLNKGFVFISNEKNSGCGMSRETGLKQASGNIIMFLDSDDYLEPNAFSVVNEIFTKYPNLDIFSFNFYKDNNVVEQLYDGFNTNEIIDPNINFNVIKDKQMVWTKAYSHKFLIDKNIHHADVHQFGEDVYYQLVAYSRAKSIYLIKDSLIHYRSAENSMNVTYYIKKKCFQMFTFLKLAFNEIKYDNTVISKNFQHFFKFLFEKRIINKFKNQIINEEWYDRLINQANIFMFDVEKYNKNRQK